MPEITLQDMPSFKPQEIVLVGLSEDDVKKKDTALENGTSNIQGSEKDGQSPSVDVSSIYESQFNEYLNQRKLTDPRSRIDMFKSEVDGGVSPKDAAQKLSLTYKEANGKYSIDLPSNDYDVLKEAENYAKTTYKTKALSQVEEGIKKTSETYKALSEEDQAKNFKQYRQNMSELLSYKYMFTENPETRDEQEIKDELSSINDIFKEQREFVKSKKGGVNTPTVAKPFESEYSQKLEGMSSSIIRKKLSNLIGIDYNNPELDKLQYNNDLLYSSNRMADMSTDLIEKVDRGFFKQTGKSFGDYFTSYVTSFGDAVSVDSVDKLSQKLSDIEKGKLDRSSLTPEENLFILAAQNSKAVVDKFSSQVPDMTKAGEAIGSSLGFMLEMAATAGIGTGVGAAAKGSIAGSKFLVEGAMKNIMANVAGGLAKTAPRAALMPSVFKNTAQRYASGEDLGSSIMNGYTDTYVSAFSESLFGTKTSGLTSNSVVSGAFRKIDSAFGNVVDAKSLFKAFGEEMLEEKFEGVVNGFRDDGSVGALDYLTDMEQTKMEGLTIGLMSLAGGGANIASNTQAKIKQKQQASEIGSFASYVDEILDNKNLSVQESIDLVKTTAVDYGKKNKLSDKQVVRLDTDATKYMMYAMAKSELESRPTAEKNTLVGGEFTEDVVEVVNDGNDYNINRKENGTELVSFSNKTTSAYIKLKNGDKVSDTELRNAMDEFILVKQYSKNKENKQRLSSLIGEIRGVIGEGETNIYPSNETIDDKEGTLDEVSVGGTKRGYVNELEGTFNAYNANKIPLGSFNTYEESVAAIKDEKIQRVAFSNDEEISKAIKRQKMTTNVAKSLSVAFPVLEVMEVEDDVAIRDFVAGKLGLTDEEARDVVSDGTKAMFVPNKYGDPLYILVSKRGGDGTSAAHEAGHAIIINMFNSDQTLLKGFADNIKNTLIESGFEKESKRLDDFASQYVSEGKYYEEWLSEFLGYLSNMNIDPEKLSVEQKSLWEKIKEIINDLIIRAANAAGVRISNEGRLFNKKITNETALRFFVDLSKSLSEGKSINKLLGSKNAALQSSPSAQKKSKSTEIVNIVREMYPSAISNETELAKMINDVAFEINKLLESGKISKRQATNIKTRLRSFNVLNPIIRERFIKYSKAILEDEKNITKFIRVGRIQSAIKKAAKKNSHPAAAEVAKMFASVDAINIPDIAEFLRIAKQIRASLNKSRYVSGKLKISDPINIDEINRYLFPLLDKQEAENKALSEEYKNELINKPTETAEEKKQKIEEREQEIKEKIKGELSRMKGVISEMVETGVDKSTEQSLSMSQKEKEVVTGLLGVDVMEMSIADAFKVIDLLNMFITNHSTYGMSGILRRHIGRDNATKLAKKGLVGKAFKAYITTSRAIGIHVSTLPNLFDNMFRSMELKDEFYKMSGFRDFINGHAKAERIATEYSKAYKTKYKKTKPNRKDFFSARNVFERGMYAYVRRVAMRNLDNQQEEFDIRKKRIFDSIDKLKNGYEHERTMGLLYEEVYNDILKDANNVGEVEVKVNQINKDAVDTKRNDMGNHYQEISEVAEGVYNKNLADDLNYSSDVIKTLSGNKVDAEREITENVSSYQDFINDGETSPLQTTKEFSDLKPTKYVDLNFDKNMTTAIKLALVDTYTAEATKQLVGFLSNKEAMKAMFPIPEYRNAVNSKMVEYVNSKRGKYTKTVDFGKVGKALNTLTAMAGARVLFQIGMLPKQMVTAWTNTFFNTGYLDFSPIINTKANLDAINKFINNSGRTIANRGIESSLSLDTMEQLLDEDGKVSKYLVKPFMAIPNWFRDQSLLKGDILGARVSWLTYYTYYLKKRGIDTNKIDYNTHIINDDAANYADDMVNKQQNPSDAELQGDFMKSKDGWAKITKNVLFPFSSFMFNMKTRLMTDVSIAMDEEASLEQKKAAGRSIMALVAESAMYTSLNIAIQHGLILGASSLFADGGDDEDERISKKLKNEMARGVANVFTDLLSPFPVTDAAFVWTLNQMIALIASDEELEEGEDAIKIPIKQEFTRPETYGSLGIMFTKANDFMDMIDMSTGETYTSEYKGNETDKVISDEDRSKMVTLTMLYGSHLLGILPPEVAKISKEGMKIIANRSMSAKQIEEVKKKRLEKVKKEMGF